MLSALFMVTIAFYILQSWYMGWRNNQKREMPKQPHAEFNDKNEAA